jgi:hypothetical protein
LNKKTNFKTLETSFWILETSFEALEISFETDHGRRGLRQVMASEIRDIHSRPELGTGLGLADYVFFFSLIWCGCSYFYFLHFS